MMNKKKKALLLLFIIHHSAFIILLSGCGARRTPDLERIFATARQREGKRPVIVIPGVLGSQLVNRQTGETVWPSVYRSTRDGLALPISSDLAANRDDLYASKILETARLTRILPAEIYVYYDLLNALRNFAGYREGDWDAPPVDGDRDTFYVFAYDWRRDNVETAREFVRRVEELKRKLNRPDLRFNIVAHSMGGLVARYAAMYGDADLPEGDAPLQPTWAGASSINKIFMFGTPNEGSAEAFATLLEGYSVTEGLRRRIRLLNKLTREDALTIPSIFQLMPHNGTARFLDENLQPFAVDLYNPSEWKRYGWAAINDANYRERYAAGKVQDESVPLPPRLDQSQPATDTPQGRERLAQLDAYFAAALRRARRFHEALRANGDDPARATSSPLSPSSSLPPVALFVFGGDCEETLAAPVILRDEKRGGAWVTLTRPRELRRADGTRAKRKDVQGLMYEPGDGRVTRGSLLGEAAPGAQRESVLFNSSLNLAYAAFVCDLHSDLQKNKTLQDNAITLLVNEATR